MSVFIQKLPYVCFHILRSVNRAYIRYRAICAALILPVNSRSGRSWLVVYQTFRGFTRLDLLEDATMLFGVVIKSKLSMGSVLTANDIGKSFHLD